LRGTDIIWEVLEVRKTLVLLLLSIFTISFVVLLPGCSSGDEGKAKEYLEKGEEYAAQMRTEGDNLEAALNGFFTNLQGPNPEANAAPGGPYDDYRAAMVGVIEAAEGVIAESEKVFDLSGVEEQKEYANMAIEIAEKTLELMDTIDVWFSSALEVILTQDERKITRYLTGDEFEDGLKEIEDMGAEIDEMVKAADEYRADKDF
jgi:hypothetical protein